MNLKVSIVIPVFNCEKYLAEAIESAQAQTLDSFEIIIVNDGSTDNSLRIAQRFAEADPRISVVSLSANSGLGAARNAGMEAAKGDYISFLDGDDLIEPSTIALAYTKATESGADIVRYLYDRFFEEGKYHSPMPSYKEDFFSDEEEIRRIALDLFPAPGAATWRDHDFGGSACTALYRLDFIRRNGLRFSSDKECASEDYLFNFDLLAAGASLYYLPLHLYHYRENPASKSRRIEPDFMRIIGKFCDETEQRILDAGFPEKVATERAEGYCVLSMRLGSKNALLSKAPLKEKKEWLSNQSAHPWAVRCRTHYSTQDMSLRNRLAFSAFVGNRFYMMMLLLKGRELLRRLTNH